MPTYRFVGGPADDVVDLELEFPGDAEAIREAQCSLADLARDALPNGDRLEMHMQVEAEGRGPIYHAALLFIGKVLRGTEST